MQVERKATVDVRRVRPEEYAAVGELTVAAYLHDGLLNADNGSAGHYTSLLRDTAARDGQAEVWVAVDDRDHPLGTVTWCPPGSPWREVAHRDDQAEFRMLAVPPANRRRGAARALAEACVNRALAERMRSVVLSSLPEMVAAHRLYRDLGFVRTPELDHHPIPRVSLWAFRLDLVPMLGFAPTEGDPMDPEATSDLERLLAALSAGETIVAGSPLHRTMHETAQQALRITAELNDGYREPAEVRALLARLWGRPVDDSVTVFPPFRSDFGRNTRVGVDVFINMGCTFQDQGGVTIGDRALIGHNVVIATINHSLDPKRRGDMAPAPVVIGADAWIGSNATILPGVTIGEAAVVAAASVVTKDVPPRTVVVGAPARPVRTIEPEVSPPGGG